jgi:hypothetical protein
MQAQPDPDTDLDQWDTFKMFTDQHDNFNRAQLEWIYRNRERNGMHGVFRKIGKRRYLHKARFAKALLEGKG